MRVIEGPLTFDHGALVALDSFGRTYRSRIADVDVHIEFPTLLVNYVDDVIDGAPGYIDFAAPEWAADPWVWVNAETGAPQHFHDKWGQSFFTHWKEIPKAPTGAALVLQARLWFEVGDDPSGDEKLASQVNLGRDEWWALVVNWMETISFQIVSSRDDVQLRHRRALTRALWTEVNQQSRRLDLPQSVQTLEFELGQQRTLSATGLDRVFDLASRGEPPMLEWQLLRDAHHAYEFNENRRALVDAASALETSSKKWLDRRLADTDSAVRDLILEDMGTLGKRLSRMQKLGWIKPRGIDELVQLRNQAAHRGAAPTAAQTSQALDAVAGAMRSMDVDHAGLMAEATIELPPLRMSLEG